MAETEPIEDYKKLYEQEQKKVFVLEQKVTSFEGPGKAKLYYALNRNMNDLADMLNAKSLKNVNMDDKDDRTMERMKIIWGSIKSLSEILPVLGVAAGVTGNEQDDTKTPFIETIAETRK
jgi:hypothetical protein